MNDLASDVFKNEICPRKVANPHRVIKMSNYCESSSDGKAELEIDFASSSPSHHDRQEETTNAGEVEEENIVNDEKEEGIGSRSSKRKNCPESHRRSNNSSFLSGLNATESDEIWGGPFKEISESLLDADESIEDLELELASTSADNVNEKLVTKFGRSWSQSQPLYAFLANRLTEEASERVAAENHHSEIARCQRHSLLDTLIESLRLKVVADSIDDAAVASEEVHKRRHETSRREDLRLPGGGGNGLKTASVYRLKERLALLNEIRRYSSEQQISDQNQKVVSDASRQNGEYAQ